MFITLAAAALLVGAVLLYLRLSSTKAPDPSPERAALGAASDMGEAP